MNAFGTIVREFVQWCSGSKVRTHNAGALSSNPVRVTIKTPLARKGNGKPSHESPLL